MFKKYMQKLKKDQRGLTLVELLAVVVILAIVAAIAFVVIGNVIDNSKKDAHVANAQQLITAAKLYESTGNPIPDGGVDVKTLQDADVLSKLQDPWKGDNDKYSGSGLVKKDEKEYVVTLTGEKCPISNVTESTINKDGRKVCDGE